jgi:hypothetical protein
MGSAPLRTLLVHKPESHARQRSKNFSTRFSRNRCMLSLLTERQLEVTMRARTLPFVLLFLTVPALAQQPTVAGQAANKMWANREIRPEPPRQSDLQAARVNSIQHDAQELSVLQSALQAQLQLLQKGLLHRDLAENLKKAEKLAKKLRQEVAP